MRRLSWLILAALLMLAGLVQAQQGGSFNETVLNTRADLEFLANQTLGEGSRPDGWTFNVNDVNSPTFLADLWYDSELLAENVFGTVRPADWIGAPVTSNPLIVVRNLRHDLELTADGVLGKGKRPAEWRGGPPLYSCPRLDMNLIQVLQTAFDVRFLTPDDALNYCFTISAEAQDQVLKLALSGPEIERSIPDLGLALRGDLERLADEELGLNTRPAGWLGNKDRNSPTLLSDTYLDLELLATNQLPGSRPQGWRTSLPSAPIYAYRAQRFNLELLADALGRTPRPRGWQGTDPLERCDPQVQNLVTLVTQKYGFTTDTLVTEGSFCQQVETAATRLAENPPAVSAEEAAQEDNRFVAESQLAFTYLDQAATQYMGIMPLGVTFKAWYRNFGNSTMMFVSGDNFAVYIDRRWTTLPQELFNQLPTTEGVKPLTFCDAAWCNGPGPTPTPTGAGALQALLNAGTPPAAPDVGQVSGEKRQVSWNNIRVQYLLDNPTTRTAQVALEICTDSTQTECEPVLQIFDSTTGTAKPVLSQFNGLNVYEFPYGYSSNLLIEGSTLFSPDIWISDPTIR